MASAEQPSTPWGEERLDSYLHYALDGRMKTQYPEAESYRTEIAITAVDEPPPEVVAFLERAAVVRQKKGLRFRFKLLDKAAKDPVS